MIDTLKVIAGGVAVLALGVIVNNAVEMVQAENSIAMQKCKDDGLVDCHVEYKRTAGVLITSWEVLGRSNKPQLTPQEKEARLLNAIDKITK